MDRDKIFDNYELAMRLQAVREATKKTQQEVADDLGIDRNQIKVWECGTRQIKAKDLFMLSKYYGVSADYFLQLEDNKTLNADIKAVCKFTGLSEDAIKNLMDVDTISERFRDCEDYEQHDTIADLNGAMQDLLSSSDFFKIAAAFSVVDERQTYLHKLIDSYNEEQIEMEDIDLELFRDRLYLANKEFRYALYELSESTRDLAENWYSVISLSQEYYETIMTVDDEIRRRQKEALDNGQEEL